MLGLVLNRILTKRPKRLAMCLCLYLVTIRIGISSRSKVPRGCKGFLGHSLFYLRKNFYEKNVYGVFLSFSYDQDG